MLGDVLKQGQLPLGELGIGQLPVDALLDVPVQRGQARHEACGHMVDALARVSLTDTGHAAKVTYDKKPMSKY
ncbi:hypothetical protein GCM10010256_45550 [Streptomyces coeruleorubidus]|nr:hypothetical protein GCM10010256_45550 [Streptomyces coeruleorubidus]